MVRSCFLALSCVVFTFTKSLNWWRAISCTIRLTGKSSWGSLQKSRTSAFLLISKTAFIYLIRHLYNIVEASLQKVYKRACSPLGLVQCQFHRSTHINSTLEGSGEGGHHTRQNRPSASYRFAKPDTDFKHKLCRDANK